MRAAVVSVNARKGAALMAVLWLIAILAIASVTALRVIAFDADVAAAKIHGSKARQLAEKGIAIGANPQVRRFDPLLRQWDDAAEEGFEVTIASEGGRFNINALLLQRDTDLLNSLFTHWGLPLEESQALVDALTDWIDEDDQPSLNGAEKDFYTKAGRINQPFNRPFYNLDEMRLVRGMDHLEALQPQWADWFTVWSGGQLDLNDAPAERIAIAAECPIEQAQLVCDSVCGEDRIRDTEDDVPFQSLATALVILGIPADKDSPLARRFTVNDPATRIESVGRSADAKRKITVILRNRVGKPALMQRTETIVP